MQKSRPWISTVSGKKMVLTDPDPKLIDVFDIAHHLSIINRYVGATFYPYSVAQHSVLVSYLMPEFQMAGLMHDAPEYVLGDDSSPKKRAIPEIKVLETKWEEAVAERFGLPQSSFLWSTMSWDKKQEYVASLKPFGGLVTCEVGGERLYINALLKEADQLALMLEMCVLKAPLVDYEETALGPRGPADVMGQYKGLLAPMNAETARASFLMRFGELNGVMSPV